MKKMTFAIGLALLFLSFPLSAQTLTDSQKADIEKAVKLQISQYFHTIEAIDYEGYLKCFTREKFIGWLSNGQVVTSFDTLKQQQKVNWETRKEVKITPQETKVTVLSAEAAVSSINGTFYTALKNGNVTNNNWGVLIIWIKEAGAWRVAYTGSSQVAKN